MIVSGSIDFTEFFCDFFIIDLLVVEFSVVVCFIELA